MLSLKVINEGLVVKQVTILRKTVQRVRDCPCAALKLASTASEEVWGFHRGPLCNKKTWFCLRFVFISWLFMSQVKASNCERRFLSPDHGNYTMRVFALFCALSLWTFSGINLIKCLPAKLYLQWKVTEIEEPA